MLEPKYRKRDLIRLGEAPSMHALNQRIQRGTYPRPDLHDPINGEALWWESTIVRHREEEATGLQHRNATTWPQEGVAARAAKRASRFADGERGDA